MLALILAGGEGTRLGLGEKPLVDICGRPMVARVVDAFTGAGLEVLVVTSGHTPMTVNYLKVQGIPLHRAGGRGYIEDIIGTVTELGETAPLFTSVGDIPCIRPEHITYVRQVFESQEKPALSTWIPRELCDPHGSEPVYTETIDEIPAVPIGVNILTGKGIGEPQDEHRLLVRDPRLALNVNTPGDLDLVRRVLCPKVRG